MRQISSIRELLKNDRLFGFLYQRFCAVLDAQPEILDRLLDYIDTYCVFNRLSANYVTSTYRAFLEQYNRDVRNFQKHGKYPVVLCSRIPDIKRREYDLALMLSTVLAPHRYRIMQLLYEKVGAGEKGLVVGCGSGIELALIEPSVKYLIAYDSSLDPFLRAQYPRVFFNEYEFRPDAKETYDKIFLIEILEHLADPDALLAQCSTVLSKGGQMLLTTATNIPQFDHLYNFEADHHEFEAKVSAMGLDVTFKEEIRHRYMSANIDAKNVFYVLSRRAQ